MRSVQRTLEQEVPALLDVVDVVDALWDADWVLTQRQAAHNELRVWKRVLEQVSCVEASGRTSVLQRTWPQCRLG